MKRNSLADEDDLMRTTRRVLFEFTAETCKRQYVVGKVVYVIGDCKWALPFDFDEFIAVGRSLLIHGEQEWRTRTFQRMGSSFAMLSLFYAQTLVEQPDLIGRQARPLRGVLRSASKTTLFTDATQAEIRCMLRQLRTPWGGSCLFLVMGASVNSPRTPCHDPCSPSGRAPAQIGASSSDGTTVNHVSLGIRAECLAL